MLCHQCLICVCVCDTLQFSPCISTDWLLSCLVGLNFRVWVNPSLQLFGFATQASLAEVLEVPTTSLFLEWDGAKECKGYYSATLTHEMNIVLPCSKNLSTWHALSACETSAWPSAEVFCPLGKQKAKGRTSPELRTQVDDICDLVEVGSGNVGWKADKWPRHTISYHSWKASLASSQRHPTWISTGGAMRCLFNSNSMLWLCYDFGLTPSHTQKIVGLPPA